MIQCPPVCEVDDMAVWVKSNFSKADINRAGKALVEWWKSPEAETTKEIRDAYAVVENWRTSHAYPLLTFRMNLVQRAEKVGGALIAQRMKRFSSVMNKLGREAHMSLSQMQDLGGCRAIMPTVEDVRQLCEMYHDMKAGVSSVSTESRYKPYDYITRPKIDGYRGIHIVGRYLAREKNNESWNDQRIEIQLRSQLQHAFATAVETVTTFKGVPLKFGGGPADWRRFFSLVGSAFALRENTQIVTGTPSSERELTKELKDLSASLKVRQRLRGWTEAVTKLRSTDTGRYKWLLLVLDTSKLTFKVTGFKSHTKASEELAEIEKRKQPHLDAVLVWVGRVKLLRRAYPNYFADTGAFLEALRIALEFRSNGRSAKP